MIRRHHRAIASALTLIVSTLMVQPSMAQEETPGGQTLDAGLEQIVVTAQRREQSLQDVPVSIQTVSGEEIRHQGFNDMEDLAVFSPGVYIRSGLLEQQVTVRGFGTIGNSSKLEQAVPIFVDGVHFGRQSQIHTAFLDVERVEILKGPQPVFFGMNATAGAFNITTKKPTPEWEGYVNAGVGNNATQELSFGVGGPISDSVGIRLAGTYDSNEGYLRHVVTGQKVNGLENAGGRAIVAWSPTDRLTLTGKVEASRIRAGTEAMIGCRTDGPMIFARGGPTDPGTIGDERSIYGEPPVGSGTDLTILPINDSRTGDCFEDNDVAFGNGWPSYQMPDNLREENMVSGSLDIRDAADGYITAPNTSDVIGDSGLGFKSGRQTFDDIDSFLASVSLAYEFDNEIQLDSTLAYNDYLRQSVRDDSNSPFFLNHQANEEQFEQVSAEVRLTSPTDGTFEWMAGLHYQETAKDDFFNTLRANVRQAQRMSVSWEDASWTNAFVTGTLNLFDDHRLAIDAGVRVSKIKKEVDLVGYGASWIFDVQPNHPDAVRVDPADAKIYVSDPVDMDNLWTIPFGSSRVVPAEWLPSQAKAVGLTHLDTSVRPEMLDNVFHDKLSDTYTDPQVTIRYRLGEDQNHTIFARWAQATKGPGYDIGPGALPGDFIEFFLAREKGRTIELGSKGILWDNRARYDVTLFRTNFEDLQLSGLAPILNQDQTSVAVNAGEQQVQGAEFSITAAVTDRLFLGFAGALLDGEMLEFAGSGCNDEEFRNAQLGLGIPELEGCNVATSKIDRTGDEPARTPDWNFMMDATYILPVLNDYEVTFGAKGFVSDGFITDRNGFSRIVMYDTHGDLNLNVGIGDASGTWQALAYANNIFEHRESYNEEFDITPRGMVFLQVSNTNYASYGVRFNYNFF